MGFVLEKAFLSARHVIFYINQVSVYMWDFLSELCSVSSVFVFILVMYHTVSLITVTL